MGLIYTGMAAGVVIIVLDKIMAAKGSKVRLHLMPIAVGVYLPVTLAVPMFVGGLIAHFADKKLGRTGDEAENTDNGVLVSSGLIAGEALMGVIIAILLYLGTNLKIEGIGHTLSDILSVAALIGLAVYLRKKAIEQPN